MNALRATILIVIVVIAMLGALWPQIPFGLADYDRELHLVIYAVIVLVASQPGRSLLRIAVTVAVIATALELAQGFVPQRNSSLRDVLSNLVGIAIGAALVGAWRAYRARRDRQARGLEAVK